MLQKQMQPGDSPRKDLRQHAKNRHSATSFVCKKPRFIRCNLNLAKTVERPRKLPPGHPDLVTTLPDLASAVPLSS